MAASGNQGKVVECDELFCRWKIRPRAQSLGFWVFGAYEQGILQKLDEE